MSALSEGSTIPCAPSEKVPACRRGLWLPPGTLVILLIAGAVYTVMGLTGMRWGLPSRERLLLYGASFGDVVGSGEERLFVTGPLQSYQVDECSTLIPLARMDPARLQFNPHWFHWGTFHLYVVGAVLYGAKLAGAITLTPDRQFYLDNPEQLAAIYQIARGVSWVMGAGSLALLTAMVRRVTRNFWISVVAVLLFATAPLNILYSHFGTPDTAVVFWVLLSGYFSGIGGADEPRGTALLLSFACAGLAASVKLHGGLAVVFPLVQAVRFRRVLPLVAGILCVIGGFVAGSPYVVLDWPRFRFDLVYQLLRTSEGHGSVFAGTRPALLHHWNETLPSGTSPLTTVLMAVTLLIGLIRWRGDRSPLLVFLTLFWVQLARTPVKFARYTMPIIPFQILLLAWILADIESRRIRRLGVALSVAALLSQGILSVGHLRVLRAPDVRDRAAKWLATNGVPGDVVGLPGRPWFATPPVSKSVFSVEVVPLDVASIKAARLRWFILTDYDTEPIWRAPDAPPAAKAAVDFLLGEGDGRPGVHTFATAPRPPLLVSWGRRLLPHDLRYHCPTIWIVGI